MFEPALYREIAGAKRFLTDEPYFGRHLPTEIEENKSRVASLLDTATTRRRDAVQRVLIEVFPPIASLLGQTPRFSGNWFADLRICSHQTFDRYFQLETPEGGISRGEIEQVIALAKEGKAQELSTAFDNFAQRNLLEVLLARLAELGRPTGTRDPHIFLTALFSIETSNRRPQDLDSFLQRQPHHNVLLITVSALRHEREDCRHTILQRSIRECSGIFLPFYVVTGIGAEQQEADVREGLAILFKSMSELQAVRDECIAKISAAAGDGQLQNEQHLPFLIKCWEDWGSVENPQIWMRSMAETRRGFFTLLKQFWTYQTSSQTVVVDRNAIGRYVPLEQLQATKAALARENDLSDEEVEILARL